MNTQPEHITRALIAADAEVPMFRITRDFRATPEQVRRAHLDPELYARWVGPASVTTRILYWDARTGGSWAFASDRGGQEIATFHGSFHDVGPNRVVQTFTYDGWPEGVSLETLTLEDLGDGWTRLHATSLVDSFVTREHQLASGMQIGVQEGYAALDAMLEDGSL